MRQTLSYQGAVAFFVLTGVAGLLVNFVHYRDVGALSAALSLGLYGLPLVLAAVLVAVPRVRRWTRDITQAAAYVVCAGDVFKTLYFHAPDALLWAILIPSCGVIFAGVVARRAYEVVLFGVACWASVGAVWLLGGVSGSDAMTVVLASSVAVGAATIGTTIRLRTEAELMRLNGELSAARQEAEAGARAKSAFLATMSHEIRTPMNGVVGMTEILSDTALDADQHDCVRTIRASADALLAIIDDVLNVSKIEAGHVELESVAFSPRALARDALAIVRTQAAARGLALDVEAAPGVPPAVLGDPARLRQVLLNLLSNAVKFTHEGSVTVQLSPAGAGRLRVAVRDTGIGIAPERRDALFDAFTQADASTTRQYGGTGLGLAISQGLVERMGGRIQIDGAPGQGSTFGFEIDAPPATLPDAHGDGADHPAADATPSLRPDVSGLAVLVAEDNAVNQRVVTRLLERLGIADVTVAADGALALEALRASAVDVVLMDVQMPVMDGLEATRRLRAELPPERQPYVIALTANALAGDREVCLAAGADAYLAKPVQREPLRRALAAAVSPRVLTEAAP